MTQQNDVAAQSAEKEQLSESTPEWAEGLKEPEFKIKLKNYRFKKDKEEKGEFFVGRDKEKRKLKNILESSWSSNSGGAYLVTGYRGVGKTEFVKEVLDAYENTVEGNEANKANETKKAKKVLQVHVNLGNEKRLDSTLVLNDIVSLMLEEFKWKNNGELFFFSIMVPILVLFFLVLSPVLGQKLSAFIPLSNVFSESEAGNLFRWVYLLSVILTFAWCLVSFLKYYLGPTLKIYRRLSRLLINMTHSSEKSQGAHFKGVSFKNKYHRQMLNNNEIELELKKTLKIAKESGWHIIFIFDELDKLTSRGGDVFEPGEAQGITERRSKKRQLDSLLGELKNLISTTQATYIFISGKDMYDAYLSELGSPNSLYESLFNDHIYIPSLLTDHSDGNLYLLDSMIEHVVIYQILSSKNIEKIGKENSPLYLSLHNLNVIGLKDNKEATFFYIQAFVHFLTIHSWGNCKRIITLFDSFVEIDKNDRDYYLVFNTKDIQRLMLSSHLYILFHHHLARIFINADDKLVVSSLAVFHYIMKFHDMGFSRSHINRMYQTVNVHSSPELTKVVEIIINKVLNNHIRRVRNSYYRYRFSSLYEQEIHYITTISEKESAAFNFSLDAMGSIKRTYKKMLDVELAKDDFFSKIAVANLYVILGNFNFWEQSFDEASTQYQSAISIYENEEITGSLDLLMSLVEVYMKRASVEERVGNYSLSAAIYIKAIDQVERHCNIPEEIHVKDSKMDMLKQPYWALKFLHLKRSAIHYTKGYSEGSPENFGATIESLLDWQVEDVNAIAYPRCCHHQNNSKNSKDSYYSQFVGTDIWHYRRAVIKLYMGQTGLSYKCFMNVAKQLGVLNSHDERTCYLGGKTLLRAGYSLLIQSSKEVHLKMRGRALKCQLNKSFEDQAKDESKYQKRMMELIEMLDEYLEFIDNVLDAITPKKNLEGFRNCVLKHEDGVLDFKTIREDKPDAQDCVFPYAIGLISLSATAFERARLNANSASAYLSVVSMWTVLMEMLPWRILTDERIDYSKFLNCEGRKKFGSIVDRFSELRNKAKDVIHNSDHAWVKEAGEFAFERNSYSTSKAMSHSAKMLLRCSSLGKDEGLFSEYASVNDMADDPRFYGNYLYQHYSMFGQMTLSSIRWEDFISRRLVGKCMESLGNAKNLPFSVRYYSTMLWLQGRHHLNIIVKGERDRSADFSPQDGDFFSEELKEEAIKALVKFYQASQYVAKTAGDSSNAVLPPLFMIYYNMWEVVFYLVELFCGEKDTFGKYFKYDCAISKVVVELDEMLRKSKVKDVSSRILDLSNLFIYALDHFSIALKMGDANSREATRTLQGKYYLDDDFEDDIFTLDWCYTQVFAPGACIHQQIINTEMARLQARFAACATELTHSKGYSFIRPY